MSHLATSTNRLAIGWQQQQLNHNHDIIFKRIVTLSNLYALYKKNSYVCMYHVTPSNQL